METNSGERRLSFLQKLGYGVGDAGANFAMVLVGSFIMFYCTNTLGISAALLGTLMMLSKVLDGVTDIIMGKIIDSTHSKMGKARFWYLISIVPMGLFSFLLFNVPAGFSENGKVIYVFIVYTIINAVAYTMSSISYTALTALCTKNNDDRVLMGTFRYVFSVISAIVVGSVTMGLVEKFGGGQPGWRAVSLIYAIACMACLLIPFLAVKELPEEVVNSGVIKGGEEAKTNFIEDIKVLCSNKYFWMLLIMFLAFNLSQSLGNGLAVYFCLYQMGNADLMGLISMAGLVPIMVCLPFVPKLSSKVGMRNAGLYGHLVGLIGAVIMLWGGLTINFPVMLAGLVLRGISTAPQCGVQNALVAEADEYSFLKYGKRTTGMMFSCVSVGFKVGTGLGTAVSGFLLEFSGFDGQAAQQTATALGAIRYGYLLGMALPTVVALVVFYFMKVESENKILKSAALLKDASVKKM